MIILAVSLLAAGAAISIAMLVHDIRRIRVSLEAPQGAPGRIAPELHVVAALLSGTGALAGWGWLVGFAVLAGHAVLAFVLRFLIDRAM